MRQTQTHWHCFTLEDRYKITAILGSITNRGSNLSPWIGWQKNDLLWTIFACIFLVFRRTVDQSEIFLSLKPSAFQGELSLKFELIGVHRLGGVRGQTHSILIALEDILQRHIFQKLKSKDYLHFLLYTSFKHSI